MPFIAFLGISKILRKYFFYDRNPDDRDKCLEDLSAFAI